MLRVVILQDAAVLLDAYPSLKIFSSPIFRSPEFLDFKARLLSHIASIEPPEHQELGRIAPAISAGLINLHSSFSSQFTEMRELGVFNSAFQNFTGLVADVFRYVPSPLWPEA